MHLMHGDNGAVRQLNWQHPPFEVHLHKSYLLLGEDRGSELDHGNPCS